MGDTGSRSRRGSPREDIEVSGCPISKGERVSPLLGAANTDPAEFPDPELVDFRRNPNRHRAFGGGRTAAWDPIWPGWSCGWRCANSTAAYPITQIKPGTELTYTAALRSVESLPLTFPVPAS